jgi:hypothetical protein
MIKDCLRSSWLTSTSKVELRLLRAPAWGSTLKVTPGRAGEAAPDVVGAAGSRRAAGLVSSLVRVAVRSSGRRRLVGESPVGIPPVPGDTWTRRRSRFAHLPILSEQAATWIDSMSVTRDVALEDDLVVVDHDLRAAANSPRAPGAGPRSGRRSVADRDTIAGRSVGQSTMLTCAPTSSGCRGAWARSSAAGRRARPR